MRTPILKLRRLGWRNTAAIAVAAVVVGGAAALTAPTGPARASAAASPVAYAGPAPAQGRCSTYNASGLSGFNIGVCISDRSTGTTAYPDIYVNAARKLGLRESCKIDIEVWDDNSHKLGDTTTDCALGHHTAGAVTVNTATRVHAFARLWFDGSSYSTGDSTGITVTPAGGTTSAGGGGSTGGEVCLFNAPKGAQLFNSTWKFGHTDWGFLQDDGVHWTFGGTEENSGWPVMLPGNPTWTDSWHESGTQKQMLDKFRAGGETHKGSNWYTQYRCAHTSTHNITLAMVAVHTAEYSGYNGLTDNCLTKAIYIFKAYSSDVWLYHPGSAMGPNWYFDHLPSTWGPTTAL